MDVLTTTSSLSRWKMTHTRLTIKAQGVVHAEKAFVMCQSDLFQYIPIFIHSGYFYSASSSPLLLRGAPDTARILCRSFMPKHHRQLQAKDLPKLPTWRLERDSNPQPFAQKATNLPISLHTSQYIHYTIYTLYNIYIIRYIYL